MITVDCDVCSKRYKVKSEAAGKRFRCKECGTVLTVARRRPARQSRPNATNRERSSAPSDEDFEGLGFSISEEEIYAQSPLPPRAPSSPPPKSEQEHKKKKKRRSSTNRVSDNDVFTGEGAVAGVLAILATAYGLPKAIAIGPNSDLLTVLRAFEHSPIRMTLIALGLLVVNYYNSRIVILAFEETVWRGLCYLFVPFYILYYLVTRWKHVSGYFLRSLAGFVLFFSAWFAGWAGLFFDMVPQVGPTSTKETKQDSVARPEDQELSPASFREWLAAPIPSFPDLGTPRALASSNAEVYRIETASVTGNGSAPGMSMTMRLYLPRGNHAPRSLGAVLVAPAGTNLIEGNRLDDDHAETLPYVMAGYAVVFYSIDGALADSERATETQRRASYLAFRAAGAGVVNARNALEFVLRKVPEVDANRIYCAGHSSAGTLSLLFAQWEPRIRGCIAYAPATDIEEFHRETLQFPNIDRVLPGIRNFVKETSPKTHMARLRCPVFLFHARNDSVVRFSETEQFANQLRRVNPQTTFVSVLSGDHYDSMIHEGIPKGIQWLSQLPQEQAARALLHASVPRSQRSVPETGQDKTKTQTKPTEASPLQPRPASLDRPQPVFVFQIKAFRGSGDVTEAATQALAGFEWTKPGSVVVDVKAAEIVVGVRGGSLNSARATMALQKAGFVIVGQQYLSQGRPTDNSGPSTTSRSHDRRKTHDGTTPDADGTQVPTNQPASEESKGEETKRRNVSGPFGF